MIMVSIIGIIKNRKNNILILLCLELFYIGVSILFLDGSLLLDDIDGSISAIIILCLTATESAIGLTILLTTRFTTPTRSAP